MSYNIFAALAVFGLFLMALGIFLMAFGITIAVMERKARRYAVPEKDKKKIKMHQRIRRMENAK